MRWLARNSLVFALALVLVAAVTSVSAFQSSGTPGAGTPPVSAATPLASTPVALAGNAPSFQVPAGIATTLAATIPGPVAIIDASQTTLNSEGAAIALVLLRNDSTQPVGSVAVAGSILDASGALIAVGSSETTLPSVILPGEIAHAFVVFQGGAPDDAEGQFIVTYGAVPTYQSNGDIHVTQVTLANGAFIGFVQNVGSTNAYGVQVAVSCISPEGKIAGWIIKGIETYDVAPGQLAAFALGDGYNCDQYLATAGA